MIFGEILCQGSVLENQSLRSAELPFSGNGVMRFLFLKKPYRLMIFLPFTSAANTGADSARARTTKTPRNALMAASLVKFTDHYTPRRP